MTPGISSLGQLRLRNASDHTEVSTIINGRSASSCSHNQDRNRWSRRPSPPPIFFDIEYTRATPHSPFRALCDGAPTAAPPPVAPDRCEDSSAFPALLPMSTHNATQSGKKCNRQLRVSPIMHFDCLTPRLSCGPRARRLPNPTNTSKRRDRWSRQLQPVVRWYH